MKEEEKTDEGTEDLEHKNVIYREQNDMQKRNGNIKKVRNCECVYLTKRCVLFRNLLTEKEVDKIEKLPARSLVEGWGSQQRRNFGKRAKDLKYRAAKTGGHTVTFLEEKFEKKLPHIFSFINKVI